MSASPLVGDSVNIRSVAPPAGTPLAYIQANDIRCTVTVDYVLNSADSALLRVYLNEFPQTAGGCQGNATMTDGAMDYRIQRGQGTARLFINWPAPKSSTPRSPYYPQGFLTFGALFLTRTGILHPTPSVFSAAFAIIMALGGGLLAI